MTARRALLVLAVVAAFAPALRGEFLRWDDLDHVIANPRVVAPDGLVRSWHDTSSPGFYPITYTTFFVEWRASGGKPWLFHLDNVLLHAASAVIVMELAGAIGLGAAASWLAAALWAVHPLQVASVAWIAERKNVLSVFLYLVSLLLFLRAEGGRRGTRGRHVAMGLSVAAFGCAVLSKAAAMTLPAAIVLVRWVGRGRLDGAFWRALVPYGAVGIGAGLALLASVPADMQTPSLAARLALAPRALGFYVRAFFWPRGLLPIYPRWPLVTPGPASALAWLVTAAGAAATVWLRARLPRALVAGLGLFAVNVSLVTGIVWFTFLGHSPVGDHLAYLPSLGLALATVAGLAALLPERPLVAILALWCAALGIATWRQIPVWHDTTTLWEYTLAGNPDCALCHYNLGVLLDDQGDREAASAHYEAAMRIEPDAETAINLGNARVVEGRIDDAVALYRRAVELDRSNEKAYANLGLIAVSRGESEEAIGFYREAVHITPAAANLHLALGSALLGAGRADEARREIEEAHRLLPPTAGTTPGDARLHRELAEALEQIDLDDDALLHYRAAHRLVPDDVEATVDLALALLARKRAGEAVELLGGALRRAPDAAPLAATLAWIRATSPDPTTRDAAEAVRLAEHACALTGRTNPDHLDTLAAAYAEAGRFTDAVRTAREALAAADPDSDLAGAVRERLAVYEAGRPYRLP